MKQYTISILLFLAIGCKDKSNAIADTSTLKPVSVEYFKNGDVLPADASCSDTLIVVDAEGLNKDMALIEQGIIDASDSQIDSVFNRHCKIK